MANPEAQSGGNKKGRFLELWKKFNTVSAAVLASAGVVLEQPLLLGLAAVDVAQSWAIGRFEKWRDKRKAGKSLGASALKAAHA